MRQRAAASHHTLHNVRDRSAAIGSTASARPASSDKARHAPDHRGRFVLCHDVRTALASTSHPRRPSCPMPVITTASTRPENVCGHGTKQNIHRRPAGIFRRGACVMCILRLRFAVFQNQVIAARSHRRSFPAAGPSPSSASATGNRAQDASAAAQESG